MALLAAAALVYFCRQRRRGAREAALAAQRAEQERLENEAYKARGLDPDAFTENAPEYGAPPPMQTRNTGFMGGSTYSAVPAGPVSPISPTREQGFPSAPPRSFSNGPHGHSTEYSSGYR